jgi:kynureninase
MTEAWLKQNIWPLFSRSLSRNEIYLANHSLGRPPDAMHAHIQSALDAWYVSMDDAWQAWMLEVESFQSRIASFINAPRVVPKTSAGQGLRAVLNTFDRKINVVATTGEFDSIDFILRVYEERERIEINWCDPNEEALIAEIDDVTDLVVFSYVMFNDSKIMTNAEQVVARARAVGAMAFIDAYHAVGVIPVDMQSMAADFMVGGSYKYMRGGPGACWLAYADTNLRTLDTGWFAKENPLEFKKSDELRWGEPFMESTPAILPIYQSRAGFEIVQNLGVAELRKYSLEQQAFLRDRLLTLGVDCFQPPVPEEYGAFSLVRSINAAEDAARLRLAGVNVDARANYIRFCPDILNTEEEMENAAITVAKVLGL